MILTKQFDCVRMKNSIQEKLAEERAGLTDHEIESRIERELERSTSPIARYWRKASGKRNMQGKIEITVNSR